MTSQNKLSLIIPAYNEGDHIFEIVDEAVRTAHTEIKRTNLSDVEIVVVNDGSTDDTGEKLRPFLNRQGVKVVTHEKNKGYGAALKTGFEAASGNILSFMDGDGTIESKTIFELYNHHQSSHSDMVVGKRFGESGSGMPLIRKIGNVFFARLLTFLSGQKVTDTASGVRVFNRDVLGRLYPLPDGLHFTPAMSSKAVHEKMSITEVPIAYAQRSGESKLKVVKDGLRFLNIILDTVLMYNPFKVFFLLGLLFLGVAGVLLAKPMVDVMRLDHVRFSDYIYRSIGALYFTVAGVQIMLFGVLARFLVSTFFKRFETGEWIHELNRRLNVYHTMGWWGLGFFFVGVLINMAYFTEYFFFGTLEIHWAWLLIAAGLIIVGVQMIITAVVMRIIRNVNRSNQGSV